MVFNSSYTIADLNHNEDALAEIKQLEQRLSEQTGAAITLIAYNYEHDIKAERTD
ncbi:hypothetical protein SAMN04487969_114148 [Paenibacillus algorifonticola]|uniref:Uncharacterized protein n=2 Tax=Paenibacillus algorifonticola TaxID=684063 RepID=A0A1I2G664_9BACL|nr:hypothetical protein SAMN04487969_114148 [Paenibacillus algorifonticola]